MNSLFVSTTTTTATKFFLFWQRFYFFIPGLWKNATFYLPWIVPPGSCNCTTSGTCTTVWERLLARGVYTEYRDPKPLRRRGFYTSFKALRSADYHRNRISFLNCRSMRIGLFMKSKIEVNLKCNSTILFRHTVKIIRSFAAEDRSIYLLFREEMS